MADKLTFGILVNGSIVEKWQAEVIQLLLNEGHKLTLIVQNDNPQNKNAFSNDFRSIRGIDLFLDYGIDFSSNHYPNNHLIFLHCIMKRKFCIAKQFKVDSSSFLI
jgi:hypothetical protein